MNNINLIKINHFNSSVSYKVISEKSSTSLDPHWITGFTDGEGCFSVTFKKRDKLKAKVEVVASFSICQHERSKNVLEHIVKYFDLTSLRLDKKDNTWRVETRSLDILLTRIIPFYQKYPLLTAKVCDFHIFKHICVLMQQKKHLETRGILQIIHLAFQMNPSGKRKISKQALFEQMGLTSEAYALLDSSHGFLNNSSFSYLNYTSSFSTISLNPWWITGFTDGEGCFSISIRIQKGKFYITPSFNLPQHENSLLLLKQFVKYFNCGSIYQNKADGIYHFNVYAISDLLNNIIPHFQKYPLKTSKAFSFQCFVEILNIYQKKEKEEKNFKDIQQIVKLVYIMNPGGKKKIKEQDMLDLCLTLTLN